MTTFQEPQPQSRRAVRQSERGDAPDPDAGFTQFPPPAPAAPAQSYAAPAQPTAAPPQSYAAPPVFDPTQAREMWDTTARRAAQPPAAPSPDPAPAPGRRAAASAPAPTAEPLNYATQARPVTPITDAPTMRARANAPARPTAEEQPPTQAIPQSEQPSYRVRDFSPDSRRAEPAATPTWAPPQPTNVPADLQYRTEVRAPDAAPVAPIPPAPISPQLEQTLTRREMRALQSAEEAASLQTAAPAQAQPLPQASAQAPAQAAVPAQVAAPAPAAAEAPMAWPFGDVAPQPIANAGLAAAMTEYDALAAQPIAPQPQPYAEPLLQPAQSQPQAVAPLPPAAPQEQRAPQPQYAAPAPQTPPAAPPSNEGQWSPPVGHWSVQPGLDDETQPYENTINRTVGSGTVTTSALVLPVAPMGSDIRGALTGTGEIMLTGSIDLPHAFSSTGATARIEHDSMDALFDMHDGEVVATDSAPVRAVMAVSTHNSGQGVTHTQKPKGTRALTALLIVASSMAVLVAGLLIVAFALNIF